MSFSPQVNESITIGATSYRFTEHPAAPGSGVPYGQEGRAGTVYQLVDDDEEYRAFKVFKPRYRQPSLAQLSRALASYADVPGLGVCRRQTLTPRDDAELLHRHHDLTYSVLMPWINGTTWSEYVQSHKPLSPAQSLALARRLTTVLTGLEEASLAHCDLSGANLIIDGLDGVEGGEPDVILVDVEQLYASGLERPPNLLSGSPGYAYAAGEDAWGPMGDRFAGAILLAEMLGWCDEGVREAAWEAGYFAESDLKQSTERYRRLLDALRQRWGDGVAGLLSQVWGSESPADCPSFGEWLVTLPMNPSEVNNERTLDEWLALGGRLDSAGDEPGAQEAYRQALALAEPGSDLAAELALMTGDKLPVIDPVVTEAEVAPVEAENTLLARRKRHLMLGGLGVVSLMGLAALMIWLGRSRGAIIELPDGLLTERVQVPAGIFGLGNDDGPHDERPFLTVYLDAFWIDKYEVTNRQFVGFLNDMDDIMEEGHIWYDLGEDGPIRLSGGSFQPREGRDSRPVTYVSWYGARAYCEWAGGRLPTEAEWEKAARWDPDTTESRYFPWGNADPVCDRANSARCAGAFPRAVGTYPDGASFYGAQDMAGNVWEWVQDAYREDAYVAHKQAAGAGTPARNPRVDSDEFPIRVIRGGSYASADEGIRAANRYHQTANSAEANLGFRCAYDR